ncbi:MAG: nucleotidyltransferase family protein [Anaerolineaceae bacterium]|nr:nucleotidyltransferase family protein [Anaerolineaceae bacterium]
MNNEKQPFRQQIAAVILAAGGSSRMGQPKLLLPWQGEALIRWPVKIALAAGLSPVIVVTGASADEVEEALNGLPVEIIHNPDWEKGQSTSLRCGIAALPETSEAAILFLGDQPKLPGDLLEKMIAEFHAHAPSIPIFIASFHGKRGNPVLFDRSVFQDLQRVEGDAGGRTIFNKYPVQYIPVESEDVLTDIDSPEDYQKFIESHQ